MQQSGLGPLLWWEEEDDYEEEDGYEEAGDEEEAADGDVTM